MKKLYYEIKTQLKEISGTIKNLKISRKDKNRKISIGEVDSNIYHLKYKFRHHHIAYCEMRKTPYEKIENPHPNNLPNRIFIEKIKDDWKKKIQNENVCSVQKRLDTESESSSVGSRNC